MMARVSRRMGRRPGRPDTRAAILASAQKLFAGSGFDGVSVRAIAADAGVDPAMINHYFDGKEGLFQAAMDLPVRPAETMARMLEDSTPEDLPRRIVEVFMGVWEGPRSGPAMVALLRRGMADPKYLSVMSRFMGKTVIGSAAKHLNPDNPEDARRRVSFVYSHLLGVEIARRILKVEPLAGMSQEELIGVLAPVVSHYLYGDLASPPHEGKPS